MVSTAREVFTVVFRPFTLVPSLSEPVVKVRASLASIVAVTTPEVRPWAVCASLKVIPVASVIVTAFVSKPEIVAAVPEGGVFAVKAVVISASEPSIVGAVTVDDFVS